MRTSAYVAGHRRRALGALAVVASSVVLLGSIEHRATETVLAPLEGPAIPADVRMPTGGAPAVHAARTLPQGTLFVGLKTVHHQGRRIGDTDALAAPRGCRAVAERIVPKHAEGHLAVDVVMDARLPYRFMRCLQHALDLALDAADVTPYPDGSRHTWVAWLHAAPSSPAPRKGVLASVSLPMGDLTMGHDATNDAAVELRVVDDALVLRAGDRQHRRARTAPDRREWLRDTYWRLCRGTHGDQPCHLRLQLPDDLPVGYVVDLLSDQALVMRAE